MFVLENNHWAESTPACAAATDQGPGEARRRVRDALDEGRRAGRRGRAQRREARARVRTVSGKGPVFLVCETYRLVGHFVGDPQVYRPKGEQQELRETQDPITKLREKIGPHRRGVRGDLDREALEIAEASVEFAKAGTDPKPEDALKNVYA